jgi:hypothetical protein
VNRSVLECNPYRAKHIAVRSARGDLALCPRRCLRYVKPVTDVRAPRWPVGSTGRERFKPIAEGRDDGLVAFDRRHPGLVGREIQGAGDLSPQLIWTVRFAPHPDSEDTDANSFARLGCDLVHNDRIDAIAGPLSRSEEEGAICRDFTR